MQIGSTVRFTNTDDSIVVGIVTGIHPNGDLQLYAIHHDSMRFIHAAPIDRCEEVKDLTLYATILNLNAEILRLTESVIRLTEQLEELGTTTPTRIFDPGILEETNPAPPKSKR